MTAEAGPRYRVLDKLGEGGMGVVFRAEDRLLHRQVALKLVASKGWPGGHIGTHLLGEARASAGLNHPNICTVYDVGEWEGEFASDGEDLAHAFAPGTPYIAMELVEGRLLSSLLTSGPLRLPEMLDYSVQIADGLAEAHSRRIVHRDLKPHNVMVTGTGRAKILDFGLAAPEPRGDPGDLDTRASTLSMQLGGEKAIRGTVPYMSPEQAAGRTVDSRSDVFSFGVMLYEMASGSRPFGGESATAILAKILEAEPVPLMDVRSQLPEELGRIVHRCLQKKPPDRYNDTRDLVADIKQLQVAVSTGRVRRRVPPRRRKLTWALGMVTGLGLLGLALVLLRPSLLRPPPLPPKHTQVTFTGTAHFAALAPDGRFVAHVNSWPGSTQTAQVVVQEIGGSNAIPLLSGRGFWGLRWSPDGSELLVSGEEVEGGPGTFLVPRLGGTPRRFEFKRYLAWSPDGSRFAGFDRGSLTVTDKRTGETKAVRLPDPSGNAAAVVPPVGIDWSPSGDWLVYFTHEGQSVILWTVPAAGGEATKIVEDTVRIASPRYAPQGDCVYYLRRPGRVAELWKVPVSRSSGRPRGSPRLVLAGVEAMNDFSISADGKRLLHTWRTDYSNLWLAPTEGAEKTSREAGARPLTTGTSSDSDPAVSPDGTRVAFIRAGSQGNQVFVAPIEGGTPQQISYAGTDNHLPVWSPDGKEIAFVFGEGDEQGTHHVFKVAATGGTSQRLAGTRPGMPFWLAWAPGSRILYLPPDKRNITSLEPATGEERALLREDWDGRISAAWYSPDGRRLAVEWSPPDEQQDVASLSVISLEEGRSALVAKNPPWILGWSRGGRGLLGIEDTSAGSSIVLLPLTGGRPSPLRTLPPGQPLGGALTPDGRAVVCVIGSVLSDVWLIENFDSDVR